jgi:CBS domain-containing protein
VDPRGTVAGLREIEPPDSHENRSEEAPMRTLRQVIHRLDLISAQPKAPCLDVAIAMTEGRIGAIPVIEGERLVGIFSERDLMTRVLVPGRDPESTPVDEVMTHEVVTATLDEGVERCVEKMQRAGCRHLPVVHEGRVVTMLSLRDLLHDEVEEQFEEIRELRAHLEQATVA